MLSLIQQIRSNNLQKQKNKFKEELESNNKVNHLYLNTLHNKLNDIIKKELINAAENNQKELNLEIIKEENEETIFSRDNETSTSLTKSLSEVDYDGNMKVVLTDDEVELERKKFDRCLQLKYLISIKWNNKYQDIPVDYYDKEDHIYTSDSYISVSDQEISFEGSYNKKTCGINAKF